MESIIFVSVNNADHKLNTEFEKSLSLGSIGDAAVATAKKWKTTYYFPSPSGLYIFTSYPLKLWRSVIGVTK